MENVPYLLIAIGALVLGGFWLFFPLFVINELKKLRAQTERSNYLLNIIANHTRVDQSPPVAERFNP